MRTLRDTIGEMMSSDFKVRLKAEREQLIIRLKGLEVYMGKVTPQTDLFDLLWDQRRAMLDYLQALELRMKYLKIEF